MKQEPGEHPFVSETFFAPATRELLRNETLPPEGRTWLDSGGPWGRTRPGPLALALFSHRGDRRAIGAG